MEVLDYFSAKDRATMAAMQMSGIARYLTNSPNDARQLTKQEVTDAHALGLAVHCFYEMNPTYPAYFTFAQGAEDCRQAQARLDELGAPDGTVVYFAVDVNLEPSLTDEYFNGVESAATPRIVPGLYGYQRMCEYAYRNFPNIGKHLWQTYGAKTVPLDGWQHLQEARAGVAVDVNDVTAPGWRTAVAFTPPPFFSQSDDLTLKVGEVGEVAAGWSYPDKVKYIIKKVWSHTPGRKVVTILPPVDPDADPTECLDGTPAIFVVNVTSLP